MNNSKINPLTFGVIAIAVVLLLSTFLKNQLFVHVDAGERVVVQSIFGSLKVINTPGSFNWRGFGTVEKFRRSAQYWFSAKKDEGNTTDDSVKTRFNDGAHGYISGSIRFDLPDSEDALIDLYKTYRTQVAIEKELIGQCMTKAIYMTGPLMSSKESYSDRRNELINDIEDQAIRGVYKTSTKLAEVDDPITQTKKWVNAVEIAKDPKTGEPQRQEESPMERFRIKPYGLNINEIRYDPVVEEQISAQQKAIMQVQTAIAKAKEAEQEKLTTIANGEAKAAAAKWEQEVIKAREVTKADQEAAVQKTNADRDKLVAETNANRDKVVAETNANRDLTVAKLSKEAAEQTKLREIAIGEGEAKHKQLVMEANGALEQKLDAWVRAQEAWATALGQYKGSITPSVITGGFGGTGGALTTGGTTTMGNGIEQFMTLMTAKTAKDLALDMALKTTPASPVK